MMNDELCCTYCGATEGVYEYHMAGYDINRDNNDYLPVYGGLDYPVEYYWCYNCDQETDVEMHENWCERITNEDQN